MMTKDKLWRLYTRAANALLKSEDLVAYEKFAPVITGPGDEGVHVSIKVYRFSKSLLKDDRLSGGLVVNAKKKRKPKYRAA